MAKKSKFNKSLERFGLPIILFLTLIAFSPVFTNDFVSLDDHKFIRDHQLTKSGDLSRIAESFSLQHRTPHYKPLVYVTWLIESAVFGLKPFWFHLNNLLLHLLNCYLIFFMCRRLFAHFKAIGGTESALAVTLLFALHPIHVESVAWAVERKDVLFSFFFLSSVFSYLIYAQNEQKKWLLLSILAYLAGTLSKAPATLLFPVIVVLDLALGRKYNKQVLIEKLPFVAVFLLAIFNFGLFENLLKHSSGLTAGIIAPAINSAQEVSNLSGLPEAYQRWLIIHFRFAFFLFHSILPIKQVVYYPRAHLLESVGIFIHLMPLITVAFAYLTYKLYGRARLAFIGLGIFTLMVLPPLAFSGVGTNFVSDRYLYLPSLGILITIVALLMPILDQKKRLFVFGGTGLIALVLTFLQAQVWQNSATLWTNVIEKYPFMEEAWYSRGHHFAENGENQIAVADYSKAIELKPDYYEPHHNRGKIYKSAGQLEAALSDFTRACQIQPNNVGAWVNSGNVLIDLARYSDAIKQLTKAIEVDPNYKLAWYNRGNAYFKRKNFNAAIQDYRRSVELDPNYADGWFNLSVTYGHKGDKKNAKIYLDKAVQFGAKPDQVYIDWLKN